MKKISELERKMREWTPEKRQEMCSCGHARVHHLDTVGGLALGHGACGGCDCPKFTWVPKQ